MTSDVAIRRPTDARSTDPTLPRTVTIEPAYNGYFERITRFPDGSARHEIVRADGTEVLPTPEAPPAPDTPPGPDAATRRLAATQAGRLCHDGAHWHAFDGALWRRRRDITREVRAALREAGHADPWPGLVAAVEQLARTEPALAQPGDWDTNPWHLGTPGGTIDLASGTLRPADPADRITRATAVTPAASADCPLWRRFLAEAMGGDADRVTFLQRFCGYALTGETCEHALLFGYGEGGNGKSVFVNIVRHLFGSYAAVAAPDLFAQGAAEGGTRRGGSYGAAHSAEIAMLAGARLVTASETEEGRTWADGRLKLLTGGDPVTARFPGQAPFTFTPRFKLIVVGNHLPVLRTVDSALRRRLCLVPFAHTPATPDRRLEAKLREEGPAILRWMIEGCVAWARSLDEPGEGGGLSAGAASEVSAGAASEVSAGAAGEVSAGAAGGVSGGLAGGPAGGLHRPAAVAAATETYLAGEDGVAQFLAERCDRTPASLETAGALYAAWCAHAQAAGEPAGTQRRFAAGLERQGLTRERAGHARFYRGVRLLREGERLADVHRARGA